MDWCWNLDAFARPLLLDLFVVLALPNRQVFQGLVADSHSLFSRNRVAIFVNLNVDEAENAPRLRVLTALLQVFPRRADAVFSVANLLLIHRGYPLGPKLVVLFSLCNSLRSRFSKLLLHEVLPQVWVPPKVGRVKRCAHRLPIQLLDCLKAFEVIFDVRRVLLGHDFDVVGPRFVEARSKQELEARTLQRLQIQVADVEIQL